MAGVAGPMLGRSRLNFTRFILGLALGNVVAAFLVALLLVAIGQGLAHLVPAAWRLVLACVIVAGFGIADLANRTPHVWRQVPRHFIKQLQPGILGIVWGADLGLLVTTQKTTSLLWAALAAITVVQPMDAPWALAGFSVTWVVTTFIWSLKPWVIMATRSPGRGWQRPLRRVTGLLMVLAAAATLAAAQLG